MKKNVILSMLFLLIGASIYSKTISISDNSHKYLLNEYETTIIFPASYLVGDYIEFVKVNPFDAGASGYYQVSISYTRGNVAAAATHVASISHSGPSIWRETGRSNNNPYVGTGSNFTIDCNTEYANPRFRIRAVNTLGVNTDIAVHIKVNSINYNGSYSALNVLGNDLNVTKFLPMTNDWDLYVGNAFLSDGAVLAIKALQNGNVGIGTTNPTSKLTVAGTIASREVKVTVDAGADFVFENDYNLPSLDSVANFIKENKHLPEIASAEQMKIDGINLSEMNIKLLQKIEEMTLYMIEMKRENLEIKKENESIKESVIQIQNKLK